MPEIINCPQCERKLRVPDNLLGQQVKCPTCSVTFTAAAAPLEPPPPPPGEALAPPPRPPEPAPYPPRYDAPPPYPGAPSQQPYYHDAPPLGFDDPHERRRHLRPAALDTVAGPAIALLVVGIIDLVLYSIILAIGFLGMASQMNRRGGDAMIVGMACGCLLHAIRLAYQIVIIAGAQKMKRLESYGFSMAVCIMAVIPLLSPLLIVGIPFGIWGLVVINQPDVKDAFYR
jgi:hypothetical protein